MASLMVPSRPDIELADGPSDTVAALAFSPAANHLAVASWDSKLRIYDLTQSHTGQGKALISFDGPVLDCQWLKDGHNVVGSSVDKTARLLNIDTGATQQVAAHDEPIKCIRAFEVNNTEMIVTGSWDKTIKYWDLRQQSPAATVECKERVYSMDVKAKLLVVATADRWLQVVNLDSPTTIYKTVQSPLKWQTRVVSCFNDASGYAIGSVEGRCGFQYVNDKDSSLNFTFRCHRDAPVNATTKVYSVNAISFHPVYGTFSTGGADGTFHFWDKDSHSRLKAFKPVGGSITASAFNADGTIFAYGIGYDWSKGYSFNNPQYPLKVMLHPVQEDECKPRGSVKKK